MNTWMMNYMFRKTASFYRHKWYQRVAGLIGSSHSGSNQRGAQVHLLKNLNENENSRHYMFNFMLRDYKSDDVLEKAMTRAIGNVQKGEITYPEYYKIIEKVNDLKKIRFAKNYDGYEVNSDLGSTKERELFKLYDQVVRNERGEVAHKLWRERVIKDPQAKGLLRHFQIFK